MEESAITVTGLQEVQKQLYQFSQQLGDKVVLAALRQGANLVKQEIMQSVPVRTGKLRRGFKVALSKIHNKRYSDDLIGVYLTLKKGKDAPFYGRFINDGWNTHGKYVGWSKARSAARTKRSGRVTAKGKTDVEGKQFIQKGFAAKRAAAVTLIVRSATAGAELLARKIK